MGDERFDMVDTFLNADHIKVSRTFHSSTTPATSDPKSHLCMAMPRHRSQMRMCASRMRQVLRCPQRIEYPPSRFDLPLSTMSQQKS